MKKVHLYERVKVWWMLGYDIPVIVTLFHILGFPPASASGGATDLLLRQAGDKFLSKILSQERTSVKTS